MSLNNLFFKLCSYEFRKINFLFNLTKLKHIVLLHGKNTVALNLLWRDLGRNRQKHLKIKPIKRDCYYLILFTRRQVLAVG